MNLSEFVALVASNQGSEVSAWHPATRRLVAADPSALRGHGLTLDGEPLDGGAGGGVSPTPYVHLGHLLGSGVQQATYGEGRERVRGGRRRSEATRAAVIERLEARRWPAGDPGQMLRALEYARVLPELASRDARRAWLDELREITPGRPVTVPGRQAQWLQEIAARAAVEAATGRAITDSDYHPLGCGTTGEVYEHDELPGARQFRVHTCKVRGRCPHCGATYGRERGEELHSLLSAALERRRVPIADDGREALAWGVVVTLPKVVSAKLGELALDPRGEKVLRAELNKVMQVVRRYLSQLFGRELRDLGVAVNLHWWSSRRPVGGGWHWHAHCLIPNVDRDGEQLRRRMLFADKRLAAARVVLEEATWAAWGDELAAAGHKREAYRGNVKVNYVRSGSAGLRQLRHRTRYDGRHPFADMLKQARSAPASVYGGQLEDLAEFARRVELLQRLKTRRYLGWLVPGQRKARGLQKEPAAASKWHAQGDGFRVIAAFTDAGVLVHRFRGMRANGSRVVEASTVAPELVAFEPTAPPKKWVYRGSQGEG